MAFTGDGSFMMNPQILIDAVQHGLKGMIGKGKRSDNVIESMYKNNAVYFAAIGGAGALLSKCIKKAET